jgi:mono/diheme cytochrome c family protein
VISIVVSSLAAWAAIAEADARRGAEFFARQQCTACHTAGSAAPDLSRRLDRGYTPAGIASRMWNHAPKMWAKMREARVDIPSLTERDAADLFAFFYASRYFERPGDAGRGKAVYAVKNCGQCHASGGKAKPPAGWQSLSDPIDLVQRMWNHAQEMKDANANWPRLSTGELTDLLVYLQNLPERRLTPMSLFLPAGNQGKELIAARGCGTCHLGQMALDTRLANRTLTDIAASMWNHAPDMRAKGLLPQPAPELTGNEIREILAYSWAQGFFAARGQAPRGERVFDARCKSCHQTKVGRKPFSTVSLVSALWKHAPKVTGRKWPTLSPAEMENLIAFLAR